MRKGIFQKVGKGYHLALTVTDEPEYHLSKFLSEIGVGKGSTPEEIELALREE